MKLFRGRGFMDESGMSNKMVWALALASWVAGCSSQPPPLVSTSAPEPRASAEPTSKPIVKPGPPLARRGDAIDTIHGAKVADPYRWLEDVASPETKAWVDAVGGYTREYLDSLPGREALAARLTELSYLETISPPSRRGKRYFFTRRHKDKEKHIHYWREGKTGEPKVLLDPNAMSPDGSIALKGVWPDYQGKRVAFKLSENNADEATMYVMDVATGEKSAIDTIPGAKYADASWDPKGTGFYYTRLPIDPAIPVKDRPGYAEIYFHRLGTSFDKDALVHPKTGDPTTFIDATLSRDGHYLFLNKYYGWTKGDLFYKDLRKHKEFQPFAVGHDAKFYAYAWKEQIYLHTNVDAPRWRLFKIDPAKPERSSWREIVAELPKAVLEDVSIVGDHLVLRYLENASSRLRIVDLDGEPVRSIELPGIGSVDGPSGNPEDDDFYYAFSSYVTPLTVFESSIKQGGRKTYFELQVPVDPAPYDVKQVWYPSKDGTSISMFIIGRKDMPKDGTTPFLLTGYGGFNLTETPYFGASNFVWLDKGGAIAIPNLRGGGEYGEEWHRAGMQTTKQNTFDDFIAAAEYLTGAGYTKPERLAIRGASNGGLLVGAAMTQRPGLFSAVVCQVPLLDMVRYHLFGSGQTWISEYGSADDPKQFKALHAYSPYHKVEKGTDYPAMLMMTADTDDRVDPLHARKFTEAVRWATANDRRILLRVETKAGHGGGDMIKKVVAQNTDMYAFLFEELGMVGGKTSRRAP